MAVTEKPVGVADFLSTVFKAVGVDPGKENNTWDGRPIPLVKGGTVLEELIK
jgi:arylsulfatase A-like enzyme